MLIETAAALIACAVAGRAAVRRVVIDEHQHALLIRDGRFVRPLTAGAHWLLRAGARVETIDRRPTVMQVPGQEVITADGVSVKLSLDITYAVVDAKRAIDANQHWLSAVYQAGHAALREAAGERTFDDLAAKRFDLVPRLRELIAAALTETGIALRAVALRDIMLSADLKKAFAEVVKARQEGLAALERARGETAALRALANAARLLQEQPALAQLKALSAIADAAARGGSTFVIGEAALPLRGAAAG
ncbi:MAG: hypothetical protein H0W72_05180 [Planctomycetes bacterium]|nr:hypothetical protein [Planctomycetota bacterium]